jgi:putative SOS response-associated peptidase YedK
MCGRFVSASPPDEIARYFDAVVPDELALPASYNVAPTDDVYAVLETGGVRRLEALHWGLVPRWAKDPKTGARMINARAENVAEKNAYKPAFRKRRCLIPADGFYEWKKLPGEKRKQPMYLSRPDGKPMAFAGLWEVWRNPNDPDGDELHSCTIITTDANETVAAIHDRMPVILGEDGWDTWLAEDNDDLDTLGKLLVPAPAHLLDVHPVGPDVNNVRNNGPDLIARVDAATGEIHGQGTLL